MKIIQATFGVFHHFDLARELDRRGHLQCIYSTFPWRRLQREGVPREKVKTFPWVQTTQYLLERKNLLSTRMRDIFGYRNSTTFDDWLVKQITPCDALIALSGAGLLAGQKLQRMGGLYICDRGSTHAVFQRDIANEEFSRWGVTRRVQDERGIAREVEIYHVADAITVPSTAAKRSFIQSGIPEGKIFQIPYGVELERFSPDGVPESDPDSPFEVLFVGSVQLRKGIPYLLQAFARLQHPRKHLRIVGHVVPEMKEVLGRLPTDNVEFLGSKPQKELIPLMSRSQMMVLPSIEEGLALVQGQALACGCPVIATEATGAEDLFTDGQEGYIVPVRDVDALADRMQRFVDDPTLRPRMSEAALKRVHSLGGWKTYGDRWEALLYQLTGQRPA